MSRSRVVVVGAGFAGYRAARMLSRVARDRVDVTLLNPTDYFLYLPFCRRWPRARSSRDG